jgi:adenosine deaminase
MLVNLHSHLEGCLRPSTAAELAAESAAPEPPGGWAAALQLARPADLTVFLAKVAAAYPFFDAVDRISRIACEAVEDAAADGCEYLELRFGPATHAGGSVGIDAVISAVCSGAREGERRTGLPTGLVVAALRHHDPDLTLEVARAAARAAGEGVVGFDLAGDELLFPALEPYVEAFAIARSAGLGLTCHAAEAAPASAARSAVALLGVNRIGHGARVAQDAEVLRWAAGEGIVMEVCPTSNWLTGATPDLSSHPARTFREAGVPVVLGDDDPVTVGSRLSAERGVLRERLGFSAADLVRLDETSVRVAMVEESIRARLAARLASSGGR